MFIKGQNEADYLSNAIRDCRRLTRRFNMATVIVAHPDKWAGRNEGIEDMTLYSIAGGAVWKNRADHGIVVAREKDGGGHYTGNTIIKIDKVRDQTMMGMLGTATLAFGGKIFTSSSIPAPPRQRPAPIESGRSAYRSIRIGISLSIVSAGTLRRKPHA